MIYMLLITLPWGRKGRVSQGRVSRGKRDLGSMGELGNLGDVDRCR